MMSRFQLASTAVGLIAMVFCLVCLRAFLPAPSRPAAPLWEPECPVSIDYVHEPLWQALRSPTDQRDLMQTNNADVYQPTGSGRVESALYGSVRTVQRRGKWTASFHEGIDIAPMRRDRSGRPDDLVYACADGSVAYINVVAGNSNYGKYVVLVHKDRIGKVYSLYAHLAAVQKSLRAGQLVKVGDVLGRMGNTSTMGIPMIRAHLHFEIGVIGNQRFDRWYTAKSMSPDHRNFHGWNLWGIDPLLFYRYRGKDAFISMVDILRQIPPAFELVLPCSRLPDYIQRYFALWQGPFYDKGPIVVQVSENGVTLAARLAKPEEIQRLADQDYLVQQVDAKALGRNGAHLLSRQGSQWCLTGKGRTWLSILLY